MAVRWEMDKRRAHELIQITEINDRLKMCGIPHVLPVQKSHVLELTKLETDQDRAEVWKRVTEQEEISERLGIPQQRLTDRIKVLPDLANLPNTAKLSCLYQEPDYSPPLYSERNAKKKWLSRILSVSERTIRLWLANVDKDLEQETNEQIMDLWLQCYTQDEISEKLGISQQLAAKRIKELPQMANLPNVVKLSCLYQEPDYSPPLYNVWRAHSKTDKTTHFGNTESTFVDNLLYAYPFTVSAGAGRWSSGALPGPIYQSTAHTGYAVLVFAP